MLEIIALIFLTKEIGKIAITKGLKPGKWKLYLVLAWFFSEIIGFSIGIVIFGINNMVSAALVGIAFAVTGYFIIKSSLVKRPDALEDDINQIGQE